MAEVQLTKGAVTIIDDEWVPIITAWSWHCRPQKCGKLYAAINLWLGGRTHTVYMHRFIMEAPDGLDVDHINGNGLDNRACNLRLVPRHQNLWNTERSKTSGVSRDTQTGKWRVQICHKGYRINGGFYDDPKAARDAANYIKATLRGEFAKVPAPPNFDVATLPPKARALVTAANAGSNEPASTP